MPTRAGTTRTFTISFPPDLAEQVERLAARESRTTSELFREAFRTYRAERIKALFAESLAEARKVGDNSYGPEDIERFVKEDRAEQAAARRAASK